MLPVGGRNEWAGLTDDPHASREVHGSVNDGDGHGRQTGGRWPGDEGAVVRGEQRVVARTHDHVVLHASHEAALVGTDRGEAAHITFGRLRDDDLGPVVDHAPRNGDLIHRTEWLTGWRGR